MSQVAPLSGVKAKVVKGAQSRASSDTTAKSVARRMSRPRPMTQPRAVQTIGVWQVSMAGMRRLTCPFMRRCTEPTRGRSGPGTRSDEIEAGAEVLPLTLEVDHPHGLVAGGGIDGVGQRVHDGIGEAVAAFGPVEPQPQDRSVGARA